LTFNVAIEPEVAADHVERTLRRALTSLSVPAEVADQIREGSYPNVSMGTMVPYDPPAREDEEPPPALPASFRDDIINRFLEDSHIALEQRRRGIQPGELFRPEFGSDLSSLLHGDPLHTGPVAGPLPPWSVKGSVVRHRPTGVDYRVVRADNEVMLEEVTDSESPLAHILTRGAVINNTEWQPHPLPPTKWQRLMED